MRVSLQDGARTLARGLRTSNPALAGLGTLLLGMALLRSHEPRHTLVFRGTIEPGQSLRVGLDRPDRHRTR